MTAPFGQGPRGESTGKVLRFGKNAVIPGMLVSESRKEQNRTLIRSPLDDGGWGRRTEA